MAHLNLSGVVDVREIRTVDLVVVLNEICERIDQLEGELRRDSARAAAAEHCYRKAKAMRFCALSGPVAVREAATMADEIVSDAHLDHLMSAQAVAVTRDALFAARAQLSAFQSVAQSLRAELELAGKGPR